MNNTHSAPRDTPCKLLHQGAVSEGHFPFQGGEMNRTGIRIGRVRTAALERNPRRRRARTNGAPRTSADRISLGPGRGRPLAMTSFLPSDRFVFLSVAFFFSRYDSEVSFLSVSLCLCLSLYLSLSLSFSLLVSRALSFFLRPHPHRTRTRNTSKLDLLM